MSQEQPEWGVSLSKKCIVPQRYMACFFGFSCVVICYFQRNSFSTAITKMVVPRNYTEVNHTVCEKDVDFVSSSSDKSLDGTYEWTQKEQQRVIGAFFWGYIISHLPGGILADIYGAKWVLNIGLLLCSLLFLFTPVLVDIGGLWTLYAIRLCVGIGQGVVFPASSGLMAHWAPPKERAKMGAIVMGGGTLGQVLALTGTGSILAYHRWPMVFYVGGILGLLWCICFTLMAFSDPHTHPYIKPEEREYLEAEMGIIKPKGWKKMPWIPILTSCPFLALVCCQMGHDFGLFFCTNSLPKYMNDVLQFPILKNSVYLALCYLTMWIVSILSGILSDWLIKKEKLSLTHTRKLMTIISQVGPGVFLVAASYAGCEKVLVIVSFLLALGFMGPFFCGLKLSNIDMSPKYASTLMAIANGIGSLCGGGVSELVGWLTPNTTVGEFRVVFWIAFIVLTVTGIVFCIWGTGDIQPWDSSEPTEEKK